MKYIREHKLECDNVCHYYLNKFRDNKIPLTYISNSLIVKDQPDVIKVLNENEKVLI